jgi:hypothetical protein
MSVLYRFNGQAAYEVDTGRLKKIRVVFGMIDEDRKWMAWYLFSSSGEKKSKAELAHDPMPLEKFGERGVGGRDIPHTFHKDIGLKELAIHPHGTPAKLTIIGGARFLDCRITQLTTKAKEVVEIPFGVQTISERVPLRNYKLHGNVLFLITAPFDRAQFPLGPQWHVRTLITGGGL